jgi:CBS domain-containing protein
VLDQTGNLIGVFSERDVLRVIHNRGEGFGRLHVADVMTRNPVTCHLDDDVDDVMGKMSDRHIAKVPVLDGAELAGIVSVGDVIKVLYDKVHTENQHLISYIQGGV